MISRALALAPLLLIAACPKPAVPRPEPAPVEAAEEPESGADRPFEAVYADGQASPKVKRLCRALRELPALKRASCCEARPTTTLVGECDRLLGGAEAQGALVLDEAQVDACVAAMKSRFSTCDRVGVRGQRPPEVCRRLFRGALDAGKPCRSNLECRSGLACHDVGPTRVGTCGVPRQVGERCGQGVDPIAVYVAVDPAVDHPECAGFCGRGICRPTQQLGARCAVHVQCGRAAHCGADQTCQSGIAGQRGEACIAGRCAVENDRCVAGRCVEPKPHGAPCDDHEACAGRCDFESGKCAMMCSLAEMKPRPAD